MLKSISKKFNKRNEKAPAAVTSEALDTAAAAGIITPPKAAWSGMTAVVVAVGIYFIAVFISSTLLALYAQANHWSSAYADNWIRSSIVAQFFYVLINEGVTILLLWAFVRIRKYKNFLEIIGLKAPKGQNFRYLFVGTIAYFILYVVAANITIHFTHVDVNQQQEIGFTTITSRLDLLLAFISLVILPPLVEEIIFRGFLFAGLRRKFTFVTAALLTSAVFAIPHLFETSGGLLWMAGIDTFILSLVLCFVREKTGSLWAGIVIHAFKNFVAFYILFLGHDIFMR